MKGLRCIYAWRVLCLFCLVLILSSCKGLFKEDELGPDAPVWKMSIHSGPKPEFGYGDLTVFWDVMPVYENIVVVGATEDLQAYLYGVDVNTGTVLWKWNDWKKYGIFKSIPPRPLIEPYSMREHYLSFYMYETAKNIFHFLTIDLLTGKTVAVSTSKEGVGFSSGLEGSGDYYYVLGYEETGGGTSDWNGNPSPASREYYLYRGNIKQNNSLEKIKPLPFTRHNPIDLPKDLLSHVTRYGDPKGLISVKNRYENGGKDENPNYLIVEYWESAREVEFSVDTYIAVYDIAKNDWLYKPFLFPNPKEKGTLGLSGTVAGGGVCVDDKYYFYLYRDFACFDLFKRELVWLNNDDGIRKSGSAYFTGQELIFNYGYKDPIVYHIQSDGISSERTLAVGTTLSKFMYYHGIMYCVGGETMYAVVPSTGEKKWAFHSEGPYGGEKLFFGTIGLVPEGSKVGKTKVLAASSTSLYAYDAIQ